MRAHIRNPSVCNNWTYFQNNKSNCESVNAYYIVIYVIMTLGTT